jgi:hypothetical protein
MKQVDQIKGKSQENLTHDDVKVMIASGQHEWLSQHLPEAISFDYENLKLPHVSVKAWNDNPSVLFKLAILEWYAAAYTVNEEQKTIANADCLAVLDRFFGDQIYARDDNGVAVVALLFDILEAIKKQCHDQRYDPNNKMQYAPSWARHTMARDILFKTGNVFLNDQLTDDEIKLILAVMSKLFLGSYVSFRSDKGRQYLESLLAIPISNEMSQRIARLGEVGPDASWEASRDRLALAISMGCWAEFSWMLDKDQVLTEMLRAKLQSDQPYALFELMLPTLAPQDLDLGNTFVEGGRLYGYFNQLLYWLMIAPLECAYGPYRRYLSHEFNVRLENKRFGYQNRAVNFDEPAHNLSFFMRCHAELKAENLQRFNEELPSMRDPRKDLEYEAYACALTLPGLPGLPAAQRNPSGFNFEATLGIQCVLELIHAHEKASTATWKARTVASLKQMLINPDFSCDKTYALKIKGDAKAIGWAQRAKPVLFSLVESNPSIAQALFDKIVLGGGCFLLNALMTNSDLNQVRYNTNTMKKVIPLMKMHTLSPIAISTLAGHKDALSLRDALMVLMFIRDGSEQSEAVRLAAFNCLNTKIGKADLKVLNEAMIFSSDEAKSYLVGYLHHEGAVQKNHQRLLSELGLKKNFIKNALTQFAQKVNQAMVNSSVAQKVNQAVVDSQVEAAQEAGEKRQDNMFDL